MNYNSPTSSASGRQDAPVSGPRSIRKSVLLQKLPFSKSTLHAKLDPRSRYHDPSIPRPRYLERSRIPLWSEQEVDAWLIKLFDDQNGATEA